MPALTLDLLASNPDATIKALIDKTKHFFDPKVYAQLDPANHAILDPHKRWIYVDIDVPEEESNYNSTAAKKQRVRVDLNRIPTNAQRRIVETGAAFETGGGVELEAAPTSDVEQRLLAAVRSLWSNLKMDFENGNISETRKSQKECVQLWYKDLKGKIRMKIHKPADGFSFYPLWNEDADLIAFGIGWKAPDGEPYSQVICLYTDEKTYRYELTGSDWVLNEQRTVKNPFGKIALVWHFQAKADYEEVQASIDRFEESQSNLADRNDKVTNPTIVIKGESQNLGVYQKGGASAIEVKDGGDVNYLGTPEAPGSITLEQTNLKYNIFAGTQTPDLSPENIRGTNIESGSAMEMLCTDANMKATRSQQGEYGKAVQRAINILIAIAISEDETLKAGSKLIIKPKFNKLSIKGIKELIEIAKSAVGDKQLFSLQAAIALIGVDDPKAMIEEINAENATTQTQQQPSGNDPEQA